MIDDRADVTCSSSPTWWVNYKTKTIGMMTITLYPLYRWICSWREKFDSEKSTYFQFYTKLVTYTYYKHNPINTI